MKAITALLLASALALAACGSSDNNNSSSGTSAGSGGGGYGGSASTKSSTTKAASSASESKGSNEVELYDNYFQPKTVSGTPGSTVTLELKNEGKAEHSFTVDSQSIDKELEGGKAAKVSVKIPASGSVAFYCKYHKALGMTGTLKAS